MHTYGGHTSIRQDAACSSQSQSKSPQSCDKPPSQPQRVTQMRTRHAACIITSSSRSSCEPQPELTRELETAAHSVRRHKPHIIGCAAHNTWQAARQHQQATPFATRTLTATSTRALIQCSPSGGWWWWWRANCPAWVCLAAAPAPSSALGGPARASSSAMCIRCDKRGGPESSRAPRTSGNISKLVVR